MSRCFAVFYGVRQTARRCWRGGRPQALRAASTTARRKRLALSSAVDSADFIGRACERIIEMKLAQLMPTFPRTRKSRHFTRLPAAQARGSLWAPAFAGTTWGAGGISSHALCPAPENRGYRGYFRSLGGATATYADYVLFSVSQYPRLSCSNEFIAAGTALRRWRDELARTFDGLGNRDAGRPASLA